MELTKEQILKIDNFLEAIGIDYVDIRLEMVDHIASEIENKIEDNEAFFQEKGFQTLFLKYMLSRKKELIKIYKIRSKKQLKINIKTILVDVLYQLKKMSNILVIISLFSVFYFVRDRFVKESFAIIILLFFVDFLYTYFITHTFEKKYGRIKIIKFYIFLQCFLSTFILTFPNFIILFNKGDYREYEIYLTLIAFAFSFLINRSFLAKKNQIESKFKFLIWN